MRGFGGGRRIAGYFQPACEHSEVQPHGVTRAPSCCDSAKQDENDQACFSGSREHSVGDTEGRIFEASTQLPLATQHAACGMRHAACRRKAALACLRAQHEALDGRQSAETKKATLGSLFLRFITLDKARSIFGAGNETRTRDPDLGKVVLYQLSYSRKTYSKSGVP